MILCIDAGNSRIKWRFIASGESLAEGVQLTAEVLKAGVLELPKLDIPAEVRLSCVAGEKVIALLQKQVKKEFAVPLKKAQVMNNTTGIICAYEEPESLGVDRWLAILSASQQFNGGLMVVDAGSAITIDLLAPDSQHLGGYILPGLRLMHDALWQNTSEVRVLGNGNETLWLPGKNTQQAVNRGCLLAAVATIERLASEFPVRIVLTGGDAKILEQAISLQTDFLPNLVLDGLLSNDIGFTKL